MATITIKIEGSQVGTITVTDTLAKEHADRFMAWLASAYGLDAEGEPRGPADMVAACWAAIRSGVFANVISHEAEQAAQAARAAVQPMASETAIDHVPA
jgi:hypothetical protein